VGHVQAQDPDPYRTPDLEPGGGVSPGATPPETPQTSGLSAPEPRTRNRFPVTGTASLVAIAVFVVLFAVVVIGLLVMIF
jgi:Family of unknown function (DUF6480)